MYYSKPSCRLALKLLDIQASKWTKNLVAASHWCLHQICSFNTHEVFTRCWGIVSDIVIRFVYLVIKNTRFSFLGFFFVDTLCYLCSCHALCVCMFGTTCTSLCAPSFCTLAGAVSEATDLGAGENPVFSQNKQQANISVNALFSYRKQVMLRVSVLDSGEEARSCLTQLQTLTGRVHASNSWLRSRFLILLDGSSHIYTLCT